MWKRYIFNGYFLICLFFMLLQVGMSSTSTIWVSRLTQNPSGLSLFLNLGLFLGAFALRSIPDAFSRLYLVKAKFASKERYIEDFTANHKNVPEVLFDKSIQKQKAWLMSLHDSTIGNGQVILQASLFSGLSFIGDWAIMSATIDPWYGLGYFLCGGIYAIGIFCTKDRIQARQLEFNKNTEGLTIKLQESWNNIATGNKRAIQQLWAELMHALDSSRQSAQDLTCFSSASGSFLTFLASLPIYGTTVALFFINAGNLEKIALYLAILPKQLLTLQYLDGLSGSFMQIPSVHAQLKDLEASTRVDFGKLEFTNKAKAGDLIKFNKLQVYYRDEKGRTSIKQYHDIEGFLKNVTEHHSGRFTIRGDNGIGKSIALYRLKRALVDSKKETYYRPIIKNDLLFSKKGEDSSAGEEIVKLFDEIRKQDQDYSHLLIDEWDAHLDDGNKLEVSKKIAEISKKRCVVEIRHRDDSEDGLALSAAKPEFLKSASEQSPSQSNGEKKVKAELSEQSEHEVAITVESAEGEGYGDFGPYQELGDGSATYTPSYRTHVTLALDQTDLIRSANVKTPLLQGSISQL